MRVLFVMRNHGYLRNYASTLRLLASRGHKVMVGSRGPESHMAVDSEEFLQQITVEFRKVKGLVPPRRADAWASFASTLRAYRDALRYLQPEFRHATGLRRRAVNHLQRRAPRLARWGLVPSRRAATLLSRATALLERAVPTSERIDRLVTALAPDVVIVTPLVDFRSYQVDYVKSARRLGIPVGLAVASWDNLTNKGVIHAMPDRVFVWNNAQKREARDLHGVPADRVEVTGAPLFDDWFNRSPSSDRHTFCTRVGLDPDQPYLLYLCSSLFIAPHEVEFVRRWLRHLRRAHEPALRTCGVLIRPHPGNAGPWMATDFKTTNVAIWPRQGALPLHDDAKADYFDAIYHSAAVVAVNTSGMIEAGIIGRRSFTMLAREFRKTQGGTVHFAHLRRPSFLTTAHGYDEHFNQLAEELRNPAPPEAMHAFVRDFVRPKGLDVPATPILADAIEALAASQPMPVEPDTWYTRLLTAALLKRLDKGVGRKTPDAARHPTIAS